MYRRYYSYNDMPVPADKARLNNAVPTETLTEYHTSQSASLQKSRHKERKKLFSEQLKTDDIVLLAVIFLLLMDDCKDTFLLLALGFIFLSGE